MRKLDARGLACPEPLLMFKRELDLGGSFQLTVDSNVAKENISRFCNTKGVKYQLEEEGAEYTFKVGS